MELELNQEREMVGISNVYDPEPAVPALKGNSAVSVAFQVLRSEVNKYRTKNELDNFNPKELHTSLREKFPDLATDIYDTIEGNVKKLGLSVENWLKEHYKAIFFFHYGCENYVLYDFDDFVGDSVGGIDNVKTAERMMRCDKLSKTKKFKVACMYCFEEDVRRIWPSVLKKMGWDKVDFLKSPQLYYWFCCLSNQLDKIPRVRGNRSADVVMFDECIFRNQNEASWQYFWNLLSPTEQLNNAVKFSCLSGLSFVELLLPKLTDQQLEEYFNRTRYGLIFFLIQDKRITPSCHDRNEKCFLRAWECMKKVLNEDAFGELIVKLLKLEGKYYRSYRFEDWQNDEHEMNRLKEWLRRFPLVWSSAPQNLRTSVIENILPNLRLYEFNRCYTYQPSKYKRSDENPVNSSEFLFTILSDASLKERNSFWSNCWHDLIQGTDFDDLQRIMEMCFENNDAIVEYKENVIAGSEIVREIGGSLLTYVYFEELNKLVNFCFPNNEDSAKHYKQQLLQSKFLGEKSVFRYRFFRHAKQFDKFISDAYGSADLATDFKNQLMSSPATELKLPQEAFKSQHFQFEQFIEFMEAFVSTEEMMQRMKTRIVDHMREARRTNDPLNVHLYSGSPADRVDRWCLGTA
ncbi:uncharacterized protein LOC135849533 isoform X3 [Planococcus citri]|uniref:uncharacterized protein LOC135849533 isoform X3 n=1 Tax=Planococcus citri TaxID=170843 RepID=UPI0031F9D9B8